nr:Chain C, Vang-like protein 2 [Homo sapiens]6XA6_D Chain D, Vang-like protein 2 [Homo sapiens]6XA7_E Chain E, Vang-like protein 2 [Homo sapiens]6XA7_F Chain F, Vang-like protein 2 [Homo sapiens]6XA7_G Chain G, Vang-like protein 2 [Homo sapiens]6XA7_H Chain H, Vang-like protein 2 [Homo sapiens]
RLQSETSV